MTDRVNPFSDEWCAQAAAVWDDVVVPNLVDPENYNYIVEWKATDTGAICQLKAERGKVTEWAPGKRFSDDDCDFILHAPSATWQKIADGQLDPVGAIASQRLHLQKGPMPVVITEAEAFKRLLVGFGRVPTNW